MPSVSAAWGRRRAPRPNGCHGAPGGGSATSSGCLSGRRGSTLRPRAPARSTDRQPQPPNAPSPRFRARSPRPRGRCGVIAQTACATRFDDAVLTRGWCFDTKTEERDARRSVTCHTMPPSIVGDPRDERDTGEEGETAEASETSHAHCQFLRGDDESSRYRDPTVVSSLSMRSIDVNTTSSANDTAFAARARSRNAAGVAARGFTLARVR